MLKGLHLTPVFNIYNAIINKKVKYIQQLMPIAYLYVGKILKTLFAFSHPASKPGLELQIFH